jgi:hypothetical protein
VAADTAYRKRRLWVRKDNSALVKREYYDKQGTKKEFFVDVEVPFCCRSRAQRRRGAMLSSQ